MPAFPRPSTPGATFEVSAAVHYTVQVLNPDGSLAFALPRKRNLILDQGLNLAASHSWVALFSYAAVGTGTTPVKRDSGLTTFTRSGSTVTASANFFEAGDVGRLFKFDSGEECYITGFADVQNVTVSASGTVAAAEGTVWYVNQTSLTAETKRTNTYGGDSGDNGWTFSLGRCINKRTFIFSAESGTVIYNELGWSNTGTAGANLFGRDVISGGVSLSAGQQLKVIVELSLSGTPATPTPYTNVVTGWTQNGAACVEGIGTASSAVFSWVGSAGNTNEAGDAVLEPSRQKQVILSTNSAALINQTTVQQPAAGIIRAKTAGPDSYVTNSFTRTYAVTFGLSEGNSTAIRSLYLAGNGFNVGLRILLDAAETKDSSHTLTLTFRLTWGRVLSNT